MPRLPLPAALLLLCAALAASSPRLVWKDQLLRPSSPQVLRVSRAALSYRNVREGSPSAVRALGHVTRVSSKIIPGLGRKYFLQFTTKDPQTKQNLGTCFATVFYMKKTPKPDVTISCSNTKDSAEQFQEDLSLYSRISDVSHPSLDQVWALVSLGSNHIEWELSTEDLGYFLKDIKNVKQQKKYGGSLELYFTVVLDNDALEPPTSCYVRLNWLPGTPANVKYDCSSEDESSGSEDGSGEYVDLGSGIYTDLEKNF
ncbi:ovocalyxin-32-like [Tiliqua scincoides]|uniref:ovocalyxin-32-like n=1 Tax=Tiliqua scincoides TaxID=71010 RepID=UPI00346353C7